MQELSGACRGHRKSMMQDVRLSGPQLGIRRPQPVLLEMFSKSKLLLKIYELPLLDNSSYFCQIACSSRKVTSQLFYTQFLSGELPSGCLFWGLCAVSETPPSRGYRPSEVSCRFHLSQVGIMRLQLCS